MLKNIKFLYKDGVTTVFMTNDYYKSLSNNQILYILKDKKFKLILI